MNFVQFHIGDWDSSTRLLSPLEKGIYIDLLMLYYSTERPIIRSYFDRITSRYTEDERRAFEYVIKTFFEESEDGFHQRRCDEEIAAVRLKSEKARKSVLARWNKASRGVEPAPETSNCNTDADAIVDTNADTNDMRSYNDRNADEILTKNQEPRTNKKKYTCPKLAVSDVSETVEDFGLEAENAAKEANPPVFEEKDVDRTPVKFIVDTYNDVLGEALGKVLKVTPARQQAMRARYRDIYRDCECVNDEEAKEKVRKFFECVKRSNFLMGRTGRQGDHAAWMPTFDWLMQQKNYTKILEGAYENGKR